MKWLALWFEPLTHWVVDEYVCFFWETFEFEYEFHAGGQPLLSSVFNVIWEGWWKKPVKSTVFYQTGGVGVSEGSKKQTSILGSKKGQKWQRKTRQNLNKKDHTFYGYIFRQPSLSDLTISPDLTSQ